MEVFNLTPPPPPPPPCSLWRCASSTHQKQGGLQTHKRAVALSVCNWRRTQRLRGMNGGRRGEGGGGRLGNRQAEFHAMRPIQGQQGTGSVYTAEQRGRREEGKETTANRLRGKETETEGRTCSCSGGRRRPADDTRQVSVRLQTRQRNVGPPGSGRRCSSALAPLR